MITKGGKLPCPVDDTGRFTSEVPQFQGQHVKEADKDIMKHLKQAGRLLSQGSFAHNYPFCWRYVWDAALCSGLGLTLDMGARRSDTPLIYKAVPSWFIRVEEIRDRLVANNKQTYWVPESVGTSRFQNWLETARDWAVSRNRYWGTPLPVWVSDDGEEVCCCCRDHFNPEFCILYPKFFHP